MSKYRILIAGAALFITLICWSLSSPINSHQDEKFHLASIWCADGFDDRCEYQGLSENSLDVVLLKTNLCTPANTEQTMYKRLLVSRTTGDCKFKYKINEPLKTMNVSPNFFYETNTQISAWVLPGHTPTAYYKFMNKFEGKNAERSVIRFRILNSLLFVMLMMILLCVGTKTIRETTSIGLFFTLIPHGLFLISSVSNTSWSFTGCTLSWAFFYVLLNQPFRFSLTLLLTTLGWIISCGIAVFSRYESVIYLLATNLAVWIFIHYSQSKRSKTNFYFVLVGFLALVLVAWTRTPGLRFLTRSPLSETSPTDLIIVLGNSIKLAISTPLRILGLQAPGWGPLQASLAVFLFNLIFFGYLTISFLRADQKAQLVTRLFVFGFIFAIYFYQCFTQRNWTTPFYLVRTSWTSDQFSPRYFIPYFPFLFGMLALTSNNFPKFFADSKFKISLLTLLFVTQAITLYNISETFRDNPSWYWQNFFIGVNTVLISGIISFLVFLYLIIFPSSSKKTVSKTSPHLS